MALQGEMIKLQGISVLILVNLKEWQYKDFVDENDDKVWDCMREEWAEYIHVR